MFANFALFMQKYTGGGEEGVLKMATKAVFPQLFSLNIQNENKRNQNQNYISFRNPLYILFYEIIY